MAEITLPRPDGGSERYRLAPPSPYPRTAPANGVRTVYAAAHVVADPLKLQEPWRVPAVDWDATLAFRRHLWGLGFKIAEAMDTSQRGMGLDWPNAAELIACSLAEAKATPGADLACGAGTDQLDWRELAVTDGAALASMAFVFASEAAATATDRSLHYHGGYGFAEEYDIQLYYRRARGWRLVAGDPAAELAFLADLLVGPTASN